MNRVLVVATSRDTKGGISSVIEAHEKGEQWKQYNCIWIETHIDKNFFTKILLLLRGFFLYVYYLPTANIIHIHCSEVNSARRKMIFFSLAKLFHKKVIVHFHSFSSETTINGTSRKLYSYLFSNADIVVVLSDFWKKVVNNKLNLGDKVRIIYNPCTASVNNTHYAKKKSILYAGSINRRKGYADLINAFAKVSNSNPDWFVTLAGNGETENVVYLAKRLGIEERVKLLGWVSGETKDRAFKETSIFCLPSYAEGFPMAVLDAWAYGLPVITTPVGGIPDIAKDGENLLLFDPGDVDKLAQNLEKLIQDTALREKLSIESKKLASTTFNINTINNQIANLYKELLNERA